MIVLKRAVAKNCDLICSFWILLDLLGFFSLIQTSIPIVPWKICVKISFFSWSSFLLWDRFCDWNILEPEKVSIFRRIASTLLAKNRNIFMLQKLHEKNGSTSEKEEWRRLKGKNPTKWHWEKGSWRWGLDKIKALQNGSGIFICFIKSWMHWFDHFLTKLSKYLWIKTGDRHYHFVEPWVIDRPFCRMETVYQNHFVETGVGSLQNGAPQPPPGNGKEDSYVTVYQRVCPVHRWTFWGDVTASLGCNMLWISPELCLDLSADNAAASALTLANIGDVSKC